MSAQSDLSTLLLIGVGTTGVTTARAIRRFYGGGLRAVGVDTDAASGAYGDIDFVLLGGHRLAGRSSGGQAGAVRAACQDDSTFLDAKLDGVRLAIVVAPLGGGTANGATGEILKRLSSLGILSFVFATKPFALEGEERRREALAALGTIASHADALVELPCDRLVSAAATDNLKEALDRAQDILAQGVTLFWRLIDKPGYLRLDAERLRQLVSVSGAVRFTAVSASGEGRVANVLDQLRRNPLLANDGVAARPIRQTLLGVLAGDDLRLSEVGALVSGVKATFAPDADCALGTVNDEAVFAGRLAVVVMFFEESATPVAAHAAAGRMAARKRTLSPAERALASGDRFGGSEKTYWHDEDLDIPTYLRRNLSLER